VIAGQLLLIACLALPGQTPQTAGRIDGLVLNASNGGAPVIHAAVVLCLQYEGRFIPYRETTADAWGNFQFVDLPVGGELVYKPGANRDGVHYPGPVVRLTAAYPRAAVKLAVCDAVAEPCPLVIRRERVTLRPESDVLRVEEMLLIDNPTSTCYVGQSMGDNGARLSLQLAVPRDFTSVTFDEEFFGRRFVVVDGKLATGIPWQPGLRELKLTYVIPNTQRYRIWRRPLDLPCADIRVEVCGDGAKQIACNLTTVPADQAAVAFESAGTTLPAGYEVCVELGRMPVTWIHYARWAAPLALLALVVGVSIMLRNRKREVGVNDK
jgi:hypothetical protein